jgi:hypothetical protein
MKSILSFLNGCDIGEKQTCRNLTVFPVLHSDGVEPYYLTLEQAIESGLLTVTEVDDAGNVNRLKLTNEGSKPILLIEGEELRGAKQNRIVNASFLIAGKTTTTIPVSCVEERRWQYDSPKFSAGKKVMHASLRREAQSSLCRSLSSGSGHRSDQSRIWANIAEKSQRMKVESPTMAMADVFDHFEDKLAVFNAAFDAVEDQVGALFAIDGTVVGMECFAGGETFKLFFDKLINSYAMDAIESDPAKDSPSVPPSKAAAFIASLWKADGTRHARVSLGATVSFQSRIAMGTALVDDDAVLHLSAFKKAEGSKGSQVRLQRFSARRARHTGGRNHSGGGPFLIE